MCPYNFQGESVCEFERDPRESATGRSKMLGVMCDPHTSTCPLVLTKVRK